MTISRGRRALDEVYSAVVTMRSNLAELESDIGYEFRDRKMLTTAVTHRSYANEQRGVRPTENERLEFLGDAVLDLVVGHLLMRRYPDLREGQLSVTRAQVVVSLL